MPTALVDEAYLKGFKKFRSEYFEQIKNGAFPKEVLDEFEIGGGYVDKFGFQRDVIPIRDKNKRLVAYSCRDITDKAPYEYKYLLTEGFDKDKVLYNLQRAKNFMGESKTIIVVEGFKSVWKLYMAGYKNAVACMGSRITNGQQALLYSTAFNVITLFDGDEAGMSGTQKALKDMKEKIRISPLFLPDEIDPADRSIEYLQDMIGIIK
jgi:DNA primase